ncbi:hypothetical protein MASR2M44_12450 [Bacteroidota bacterium]
MLIYYQYLTVRNNYKQKDTILIGGQIQIGLLISIAEARPMKNFRQKKLRALANPELKPFFLSLFY